MLLRISDRVRECLARAGNARELASATADPGHKAELLALEANWMRLAESYKFVEQLSRFIDDTHVARTLADAPPTTGVLIVECRSTGQYFSTGILTDAVSYSLLPQQLNLSHCPHCGIEHQWWPKDARLVEIWPQAQNNEPASKDKAPKELISQVSDFLSVLVRTATDTADGKPRAAFYIAKGSELYHVAGMPEDYARQVNGFVIGPNSLACGLAAFTGRPILTRDVAEEPLWKPWLWLAAKFDYRGCWSFPVADSIGNVVGTFAVYHKEPREPSARDLDLAATMTRAAGIVMSRQQATMTA